MATLHLELDIDSDVHPELYVRLASIERSPARQEKLRQLAATGLIWEIARLHGPAFSEPEAVTLAPPTLPASGVDPASQAAVDAGSVADHAPVVPDNVPLLVDVVDQSEIAGRTLIEDALPSPAPPPAAVEDAAFPPPVHELPSGRPRSARIKRMRDSGLFQSG
ncbi:MAG: hypothetical protein ACJ8GJ_01115 [Vitreoscilla sp.]